MKLKPGTDVAVTIPNARVAAYDPATDRYYVHSPAFYGGAWVDAHNVTPPPRTLDEIGAALTALSRSFGTDLKETR